ncbi:aromatic ring-hydroxylating dioxygenase subunit alpha [Xanthobacter dioxanivorans]|uniref:Aromatic ring-hydroxylating dioxygenase subunit alpha n=1 Tax=Xanthobacter dioxanivorans TaxID=2528964 RepID=A0A974PSP8_9HYPH|nr:aromatic ring-hydroxylating dioxygenase subunit alpha [Xanthobacter dioxanivorans]QRG08390.1 aromatic ring-hydroxylating dioxygenase subunit alpha [Xanthobacter dioxanivorans]
MQEITPNPDGPAFPLNSWYAAGWSDEIGAALTARRICDKPVLLYRCADGTPTALEDVCWHRLVPLSAGKRVGDQVACPYHGLVFNRQGRCTHMPSQQTVNPAACVKSYPVVERHRFVWIWMGDPRLADPALVPDLHQNSNPAWAGDGGLMHMDCDYRLLIDNLMDLTHETFVHSSSIGNRAVAEAPFTVRHDGDMVMVTRWMIDTEAPPLFRAILGSLGRAGNVDRWQRVTFHAPSTVTIDVGAALTGTGAPEGDRSQGFSGFVIHVVTPVTATRCEYRWIFLRNFSLDDEKLTEEWRDGARSIFGEDKLILEMQQKSVSEFGLRKFYYLNIDGGALWARRIVERMVAREQDGEAVDASVAAE